MRELNHLTKNINILTKYGIIVLGLIYPITQHTYIQYSLLAILVLLTMFDIVNNMKSFIRFETIIGLLFVCSFLVSICINRWTITNAVELMNTFLIFANLINVKEDWDRSICIKRLLNIFILITAIIAIISLIMYITYYEGSYWLGDHYEYIGMKDGRLWGLFNANITSFISLSSVVFTLVKLIKSTKYKEFFIINLILQAHVLIYSQSRSIWIAIVAVIITLVYTSNKWKAKSFLVKALLGFIITLVIYIGVFYYNKLSGYIPRAMMNVKIEKNILTNIGKYEDISITNMEDEDINVQRSIESGHISQGRFGLWKDAFKIIRNSPIFGNSLTPFREDASRNFISRWVSVVRNAGVHNIYIMVMAVTGAAGLLIFLIFVIFTIIKFLKYILFVDGERHVKLLMAFSISMFFEEMIESRMLFMMNYYIVIVFMVIGYCYYKSRNVSKLVSSKNKQKNH